MRRDPCVEQTACPEGVIAIEGTKIVIGVVEDLFDRGIREQRADRGEVGERERIDDLGAGGAGELDQEDPVAIAVEAGGFRVGRYERLR